MIPFKIKKRLLFSLFTLLSDLFIIYFSFTLAFYIRFYLPIIPVTKGIPAFHTYQPAIYLISHREYWPIGAHWDSHATSSKAPRASGQGPFQATIPLHLPKRTRPVCEICTKLKYPRSARALFVKLTPGLI